MSTTTAPAVRPLRRLGLWWDGVVDRYNRQPMAIKIVEIFLVVVLVYALPLLRPPVITTQEIDFGGVMFGCAAYALIALGLNIVIGYAGLLDLGYIGFYATGAYTVGVLTSYHWHWPFFLALPLAIAVTMVTGVILGAPTLRVRGDYLAIVTLGFGEIIRICVKNIEWLGASSGIKDIAHPNSIGGGPQPPFDRGGLFDIPRLEWNGLVPSVDHDHPTAFLSFGAIDAIPYYWLLLTALILVLIADRLIKASRVGRAWEATREDEDAAELMGVPTFKFKLLAVRDGRRDRRHVRGVLRQWPERLHQPRQLPAAVLDAVRCCGHRRWCGQPVGRDPRRCAGLLPAGAVPGVRRLPPAGVRPGADAARRVASAGPAAAAAGQARPAGRGEDS